MSGHELLDEWICEGKMEKDAIQDRMVAINDDRYRDIEFAKLFPDYATRRTSGELYTSEEGFVSFLCERGTLSSSLQEQGRILYQSFLYLSSFPFVRRPPKAMTMNEFFRACEFSELLEMKLRAPVWGQHSRYRTISDRRRLLFQSLATTRDGRKLPFNAEEWSKQAARRSSEVDELPWQDPATQHSNFDEHGDEMYHDTLHFIWASQAYMAGDLVPLDHFYGLARELHGDDLHLHHLSIPRSRFRCLVKLLVLGQFGDTGDMDTGQFPDLDRVVDSVVRPFFRIAGIGITWPMFDDAIRLMPDLLRPIPNIAESFYRTKLNKLIQPKLERLLKNSKTPLSYARLVQLSLLIGGDIKWNELRAPRRHQPPLGVPSLLGSLAVSEYEGVFGLVILLIYGKVSHTGEDAIFGAVIPSPTRDGSAIQDFSEHFEYIRSSCLFELSPAHDVSWGNVGKPGRYVSQDRICFGDPEDGAAMVLEANMTRATLIKNVNQTDPVYSVSPWREDSRVEVRVESIDVWKPPAK